MCGITGLFRRDGHSVDTGVLERMTRSLFHRGPDGEGTFSDGGVGLGNRRLRIMDPAPRGDQPMSNEDGSVWLTYNGEIYDAEVLREWLESRGHRFETTTDTEVLVHLYEEEGESMLDRLNGMFAFALWDANRKRMLLARDHSGIKPLFYHDDGSVFRFGSEVKAILADHRVPRELDLEALHHFLSYNYVPVPATLLRGIRQVPPGEALLVNADGARRIPYWDLSFRSPPVGATDRTILAAFEAALERAVSRTLVSDVDVGILLSGGLDSSAVTYYASRLSDRRLRTFCVGFEEESYSELDAAREVADACGTEHRERIVRPNDLPKLLPHMIRHAEEPLADASMVGVYHVAELASEHVKVVLSGDGSDEHLAGYETYTATRVAAAYQRLPRAITRPVRRIVESLPVSDRKVSFTYKAKRFVRGAGKAPDEAHYYWRLIFDEDEKRRMYTPRMVERTRDLDTFRDTCAPYFARADARHWLDRLLYVDSRSYLPADMLPKVDRMTMAHSLEARVPFLDRDLVAQASAMPARLKLKRLTVRKHALRRALAGKLPSRILRRRKRGFNTPVGPWLKGPLREMLTDELSESRLRAMGVFRPQAIERLVGAHLAGRRDLGYELWGLMVLGIWWRQTLGSATNAGA